MLPVSDEQATVGRSAPAPRGPFGRLADQVKLEDRAAKNLIAKISVESLPNHSAATSAQLNTALDDQEEEPA